MVMTTCVGAAGGELNQFTLLPRPPPRDSQLMNPGHPPPPLIPLLVWNNGTEIVTRENELSIALDVEQ